jgi:hypothetical protein
MMTKERHVQSAAKVPTILCDPSSWESFRLFNPNDWTEGSKNVINSAGSQYGLIIYQTNMLKELNLRSEAICYQRFKEFQSQWNLAKWDLDRGMYLVDIPAIHLNIQSLFSTVKTYLDLAAQLISTESIVSVMIDGFHKSGDIVGGRFLNTLNNNAIKERKGQAQKIHDLVIAYKIKWIDEVIKNRDLFTHPVKGLRTVMFELLLHEDKGQLILIQIKRPEIGGKVFDVYSIDLVNNINDFTKRFLYLAKNA